MIVCAMFYFLGVIVRSPFRSFSTAPFTVFFYIYFMYLLDGDLAQHFIDAVIVVF